MYTSHCDIYFRYFLFSELVFCLTLLILDYPFFIYFSLLFFKFCYLYSFRSEEAGLMRQFFGIDSDNRIAHSSLGSVTVDNLSCVSSCNIDTGSIKNSVLCNVRCNEINAEGCILINVTAKSITAKPGSILYNIVDDGADGLTLEDKAVFAGVFSGDGSHFVMGSTTGTDGGRLIILIL